MLKKHICGFDVDKFKTINDVHGHNAGVVQPFISEREEGSVLAGRILDDVAKPVPWEDVAIDVRISIGIAVFPQNSIEANGLIHNADHAMYAVKQLGGNNYSFCRQGIKA